MMILTGSMNLGVNIIIFAYWKSQLTDWWYEIIDFSQTVFHNIDDAKSGNICFIWVKLIF